MLETLLLATTISVQFKAAPSVQLKDDYYCYQRTPDGQIIDMAHMCPDPPVMEIAEPPPPPQPPVVLSNGDLECSFLREVSSSLLSGAGETISVPAVCTALREVSSASVRAQLKSGNRVLDTQTEFIEYIQQGETYAYDATFSTDFASDPSEDLTIRFIP